MNLLQKNDDVIKETDQLLEVDTEILGAVGTGKVLPLEIVNDSTFSSLALGNGLLLFLMKGNYMLPVMLRSLLYFRLIMQLG